MGEYLKKGSKVYIEGRLQTRKWTDQQGVERYSTEIVANELQMLDSKPAGAAPAQQQRQAPAQQPAQNHVQDQYGNHAAPPPQEESPLIDDQDIPF